MCKRDTVVRYEPDLVTPPPIEIIAQFSYVPIKEGYPVTALSKLLVCYLSALKTKEVRCTVRVEELST